MSEESVTFSSDISPGDVIALGDIHGSWKPYQEFLEWVSGSHATVVILGDMIDRGGEDLKVLEVTRQLWDDPESWGLSSVHVLKGNHEKMFLNSFSDWGDGRELFFQSSIIWFQNGGSRQNAKEMARLHYEWVEELPILLTIGETVFVHGGIYPGEDPRMVMSQSRSASESFLWMREPFLEVGPKFEEWNAPFNKVVHGHTPTPFEGAGFSPVHKGDRVNIDTGCCFRTKTENGRLTAYNVTKNTFNQFINV